MAELLNVDDVVARIVRAMQPLSGETVPLIDALQRVLAQDVVAPADVPSFASSSMDGYAVRAGDTSGASLETPVRLRVVADIPAGVAPRMTLGAGEAARIMTGAPVPEGADAIVPVEDTSDTWRSDGSSRLSETVEVFRAVKPGDYIRPPGENLRAGETVLEQGTVLRPQDIGIIASLGLAEVPVYRRPRVAIISTGSELVEAGQPLAPGQIYNSNGPMLAALVRSAGGEAIVLPTAPDTLDAVRGCFEAALQRAPDLIISSAGVSVGTHDVVRAVVEELGEIDLWRVNVRPGKPLVYGHVRGIPYFGLPGNPVSAMVTFDLFVRPALNRLQGARQAAPPEIVAVLGEAFESDGRRSYLRVRLERSAGRWVAYSTGTQSSAALLSMVQADGLLILPEGVRHAPAGSEFPVRLLRPLALPG